MSSNRLVSSLVCAGMGVLLNAVPTYAADAIKYDFKIGSQPLTRALQEFATQSGIQIIFFSEVTDGIEAPAVAGKLTAVSAISRLLDDSQLTFRQVNAKTIEVQTKAPMTSSQKSKSPNVFVHDSERAVEPTESSGSGSSSAEQSEQNAADSSSEATQADAKAEGNSLQELVVTGTLIRGIAPAGAHVITVDPVQIQATGAVNSTDVLNNIPQLGDFGNTNQQISAANLQITVTRPNIRNLPGLGQSGGSTTLLLVDGHRLVGVGIKDTAPDPNLVPPTLLERVEVLPDGGSSTYGADAIGGVINFITKRHFDGVQFDARYGLADDYHTYDASATAGHDWGRVSAYISYAYTEHNALFGRDRDYVRHYGPNGQLNPDLTCTPGNVLIRSGTTQTNYALPGLAPNTANGCDTSDNNTFFPRIERHSVFSGLSVDFTDALKLDVRSYYSTQIQTNNSGPFNTTSTISGANPFYEQVPGQGRVPENVSYNWSTVLGNEAASTSTRLSSWGITPTLTWDIGDSGWQIRQMSNYGGSETRLLNPALNPTPLSTALASTNPQTAFDPYNVGATNPAVLANIENWELYGYSKQQLLDERVVADGGLFKLPGGEVHVASGAEFMHERYEAKQVNVARDNQGSVPFSLGERNSYALFAETNIPIVGEGNAIPAVKALNLSASGRYDHYSDFGGTFNPKFALTWEVLDWVKFRGNWGTAFNAPSLGDTHAVDNSVGIFPAIAYPNVLPGQFTPGQANWPIVALQGGLPNLKPQTAHTWEVGSDFNLPFLPELKFNLTYYHISFVNLIGSPPEGSPITFYTYYTQSYTMLPTAAQVTAAAAGFRNGLATVAPLLVPGALPIYELNDDRRRNLGNAKVGGLDFGANYVHPTDFGSIDASFNGSYDLQSDSEPLPGLPFIDNLAINQSRFRFATTAGLNLRDFRTQLTWDYIAGFRDTPLSANNNQSHIGSFSIVKLYLRYDLSHVGSRLTNNLSFNFTIDNLLNRDPPIYQGQYNSIYSGYANGSTVGRLFLMGVSKKF